MQRYFMFGGIVLLFATAAAAQTQRQALPAGQPALASGSATEASGAEIGIGGIYRVGYWTGIRWPAAAEAAESTPVQRVETLDGDGVRVRYRQPATDRPADPAASPTDPVAATAWSYAIAGSTAAPLRLFGAGDELLWRGRFSGNSIAPATPWVVVIGDPLGLESIGRSELLGREATVAVAQVASASDLPDRAAGWDGVDLLVINASGTDLLGSLGSARVAAILDWVSTGGRLLVSLGKDGRTMLAAAPWLAELVDLPLAAEATRLDPAALETYTSSQSPLPTLEGIELPARGGRTLIAGRTTARQPARLAIEHLVGLGRVVITAFAPDSPEMAAWPQRTTLIARLHPGLLDVETERRREARTTAAVAYDDLAGQLHAALDRFDSHRRLPFSIVSLILLAVAALVGPLDYWLVNRVFGKPLLGWLSFPLSVLLVCGLLLVLNDRGGAAAASGSRSAEDGSAGSAAPEVSRPGERGPIAMRSNRIEIVDINAVSPTPVGRGISLIHVSSPTAALVDFDVEISTRLSAGPTTGQRGDAMVPQPLTGPYGYPSTTFGGISIAGENRSLPPYEIALRAAAAETFSGRSDRLAGGPLAFPIAPAGSKGWMTRWSFQPAIGETGGLSQRRGSELITGSVANPLAVDLLDGVLVYGNWAYLLPTRFRAGQRIETIDSLRQKNFRWHLSRREVLENSSRMETWNVQMHDDFQRLSEVLMFESAIGGRDYTGLSNRPLGGIDLSHVLAHGHAILYGRLPEPVLQTPWPQEQPAVSTVRVILPVAPATLRGR